ncbi:hypothetical protein E2C01_002717 [Portunus trituberculatus]|uniref:Uncharacterized protein n=1 Tax=Portunus trituberculatus TaxID=210409 RepID=A0A5B7CKN2_PORTR|nr:hypothetical protein [Portunus trituberculatus]
MSENYTDKRTAEKEEVVVVLQWELARERRGREGGREGGCGKQKGGRVTVLLSSTFTTNVPRRSAETSLVVWVLTAAF